MSIVQVFQQSEIRFVEHPENKFEFGIIANDLAVILEANEGKGLAKYVDDTGEPNYDYAGKNSIHPMPHRYW